MSIVSGRQLLLSSAAAAAATGISRSLRFNSSDSAYLSRTPASAGNRKTWTWAGWVKRSNLTDQQAFWSAGSTGTNRTSVLFDGSARIRFFNYAGSVDVDLVTTPVYRDASAWYHFVIAVDTTQGTASNRIKLYVNGVQVTAFSTSTYPSSSQDLVFNSAIAHGIGRGEQSGGEYFSGYLADIYFIDGQALTPSSFTETDATTGQLIHKAFSGSYGSQGWHLEFADNSSNTATTLGKDTSGNGNNWTPNNLSVSAGAGNDSLVDVPTNGSQTDTGVGGEVRGNYAVFNALGGSGTLANGNLEVSSTIYRASTIGVTSGKWYCEFTAGSVVLNSYVGIYGDHNSFGTSYAVWGTGGYFTAGVGSPSNNFSSGSITQGDIIGVAFDCGNGTLAIYRNGSSLGQFSSLTLGGTSWLIGMHTNSSASTPWTVNFGQRPFAYTAPSGFKALNTANLPAPVVTKPNTVMDVALYTGNGSARSITGLGFNPDLVWIKSRSAATDHELTDSVRGTTKSLSSNLTAAEATDTGGLTAFNSDGFSLGTDTKYNNNAATYAAWAWDAGSSTVTNTAGSISSQVRANASAGFSIVTYTGNGSSGATVGHGLGAMPGLIIIKGRSSSGSDWPVWHSSLTATTGTLWLNLTVAQGTYQNRFDSTGMSSTVFKFGTTIGEQNTNGTTYVAYCFAPVVGYSNGFSYTGNGSTDGVFVYLGMRPKLLLIKRTDTTGNWYLWDTVRNTYNVVGEELYPNLSSAAATATDLDILSNGFKMRSTTADFNASGGTYVGFAWAESPFNYSRAR